MSFLLIDFGASYIKAVKYQDNALTDQKIYPSPFRKSDSISREALFRIFGEVLSNYPDCDRVVCCSILNGGYMNNIYYSWKTSNVAHDNIDLITGLFTNSPTFHQHEDHNPKGKGGLQVLGTLYGKQFYSILGDTNCVKRSVPLGEKEYILNLGTGSQILGVRYTHCFIPSGRAFYVYQNFFKQFGFDMFEYFSSLTVNDILRSTIEFDLNVFEQSHLYNSGGSIQNINESQFNKRHFFSSMLKSYIFQYVKILKILNPAKVYLTGGISRKYPVIREVVSKELGVEAELLQQDYEDTHIGMCNIIKENI
mgnify:CR=1 FL=1